ncbi:hypothetical protein RUM43_011632 [Polyplax serrata]|uniref:Uncharacterized protein n=1 Tax=Polyplax serrata TaxID=468196 RepID=A0AAN8NU31_POLSC
MSSWALVAMEAIAENVYLTQISSTCCLLTYMEYYIFVRVALAEVTYWWKLCIRHFLRSNFTFRVSSEDRDQLFIAIYRCLSSEQIFPMDGFYLMSTQVEDINVVVVYNNNLKNGTWDLETLRDNTGRREGEFLLPNCIP